ncbi:MAG: type I secretion system permease/ATPase [Alphaproteobacteria bacterium]|nr:MAG: type I secretion system permease/ATPase [Alphaproteobacteria bacterium]
MSVYDEYKKEEQRYIRSLRVIAVLAIFANLCMLAMPAFMFQLYSRVLQANSVETLVALLAICLVILVAYGFVDSAKQNMLARSAIQFESRVAGRLLAGELARQQDSNGESVKDLASLRMALMSPGFGALFDLPMLPLFLGIVYYIHPILGLVVTLGAIGLFGLAVWGNRVTIPFNQKTNESMAKAYRSMDMHMRSQEIIRAQGSYVESVNHWGKFQGQYLAAYMESSDMTSRFSSASKASRQILQIVMMAVGAFLVLDGDADIGVIFGTALVGARALQPVEQIVGGWRFITQGYDSLKRLRERMAELQLPEDRTPLPRPKGEIVISRLAYVPGQGMEPILRNVNCRIAAGDSVAIIGGSGSGKSTLARLIVGYLEPSVGHVKLDGTNLSAWDPVTKGLYVGYLPQNQQLFEASVLENIARMRRNDPPEMAIEAARRAEVHDILARLPKGYDTVLSRGGGFWPSGGQAQMIALARALYADPQVVVFDEPETGLDSQGEAAFYRVLQNLKAAGKTVIVVTHRPSALRFVDKVMFMKGGQIEDFGPRDEVMQRNGITTIADQRKAQQAKTQQTKAQQAKPAQAAAAGGAKAAAPVQKVEKAN